VALSLVALIAAGGIAFDYARMASMNTELQSAADHAALAAATQLDGQTGACDRARAAAVGMVSNQTLMANDHKGLPISITQGSGCAADPTDGILLYQDIAHTVPATSDSNANYVMVVVDSRTANFALTPIVGALSSTMSATAFAGLHQAICKMPPLMVCNPNPGTPFDADALRGVGIQVTGHGNNNCNPSTDPTCKSSVQAWGPGDFGFLDVGSGKNSDLIKALAFQDLPEDCLQVTDQNVTTGNPQGVYDAINTRFDIYNFSSGGGTTLGACFSGSCPAAADVVKDLVNTKASPNASQCKIGNNGWQLPANQFAPHNYALGSGGLTTMDSGTIDAMGLPRDNCHYTSFGKNCSDYTGYTGSGKDRIGNGEWARGDYFTKNHPDGSRPPNPSTITRYQTYLWEIANSSKIPNNLSPGQRGTPVCSTGTVDPNTDRRVLSVAVVENCAELSGSSRAVQIGDWVDMFLVEPTVDARGNGSLKDSIYMEVIGRTGAGSTGSVSAQTIRKSVPYLIE
jgi:hypothetical protein